MKQEALVGPPAGYVKPGDMDGHEAREYASQFGYWKDARWGMVERFRKQGKNAESNGIVFAIRSDWGL